MPQADAYAVYAEHIRALNACDWVAILAQYPDDAEIHLSGGLVVKGREAIGELFAGFVLPAAEGGLCGITFTEESRFEVGHHRERAVGRRGRLPGRALSRL